MRRRIFSVFLLTISLLMLSSTANNYAGNNWAKAERPQYVPGEVLVKLKADAPIGQITSLNDQFGTLTIRHFAFINVFHLKLPADLSVENTIQALEQHPLVEYVVPNHLYYLDVATPDNSNFPNDPSFGQMWGLHNTGQDGGTPDADIDAPEAWTITTGSDEVVIAVIDSGVDLEHPDLAANIWTNPGEIPDNGIDDDGNGFIDDVHGWDFSSADNDPSPAGGGCLGHGTHVAGTIGAVGNNGVGVTGVNWNVKIMPLKAFKPAFGIFCAASTSDLIAAIEYYTVMGVRISNNSWGGNSLNLATLSAIRASKSVFVVAAGNGGLDAIGDNNDIHPQYPASYGLDNIIAVAATNHSDKRAIFSNYGRQSVDLGAPGVPILSTLPDNNYGNLFGTSMATPHVAGVAGLLLAQDPTLTNKEIKWRILHSTDYLDLPVVTGGRLNAHRALQYGLNTPTVTVEMTQLGSDDDTTRGRFVLFRFSLSSNDQTGYVAVRSRVYVQLANGFELALYRKSVLLAPGETRKVTLLRWIPGTTVRLLGQAETDFSFDESGIEYPVASSPISSVDGYEIYLPLIQAE